ncbi:MAG: ATP-binding cassette domain-containing protein, partial [Oleiphilaceae bacterium]
MTSPLVDIRGLEKRFDLSGNLLEQITFKNGRLQRKQEAVHAINGVDLQVHKGEALCVVGESGCGKSTIARTVMGLLSPSGGEVHYSGQRIDNLKGRDVLPYRR